MSGGVLLIYEYCALIRFYLGCLSDEVKAKKDSRAPLDCRDVARTYPVTLETTGSLRATVALASFWTRKTFHSWKALVSLRSTRALAARRALKSTVLIRNK